MNVSLRVRVRLRQRADGLEVWVQGQRHWSALDWSLWSSFFFFIPPTLPTPPSPPLPSPSVFLSLSPSASDVRRAARFRTGWTTLSRRAGLCCHDDEASLQPVTAGCNNTPWILAGLATLIKMTLHVSSSPLLAPHSHIRSHMATIGAQKKASVAQRLWGKYYSQLGKYLLGKN